MSSGADLYAQFAIDAVAQAQLPMIGVALAGAPRVAAPLVVGHDQRVVVEHDGLKARVGAHVLAHLLAHPAGVDIGGEGEERDPE